VLRRLFLGFYGGRTEVFARGSFTNAFYYDYNSLYPSVMQLNRFPDPNSQRVRHDDRTDYIENCEGVSEVIIDIPFQKNPPLPFRCDGKLMFPFGKQMRGSWSHIELRHAVDNCGCKITKVFESIYYPLTCNPFETFVKTLYELRRKYQAETIYNPMEKVIKLLMNNLYGKFGEKFDDKSQPYHPNAFTPEVLQRATKVEHFPTYIKVTENQDPKPHCIPIWAIYVTAYGRIKMHKAMMEHPNTIYCDTDSLITKDVIPTSTAIGELKLERDVAFGLTIMPKMYATFSSKGKDFVKIKGLGRKYQPTTFKEFSQDFVKSPMRTYSHFVKFNEAVRKEILVPNQIILRHKTFKFEDNKRDWKEQVFDQVGDKGVYEFQESDPLEIVNGKVKQKSQGRKLESQQETNDK